MRLLKFIGVFLAVFIVIAALIVLPSLKSVRTIIKNFDSLSEGTEWLQQVSTTSGFLNYIEAHPRRVSLYSYMPGHPDSTLDFNGERMVPVGTLSGLVLVASYAHMVVAGKWHMDDLIPLDSVTHYQLPGIYSVTDQETLSELAKSNKKKDMIRLDQLARLVVQNQDLPAADYLYWRIGPSRLDSTLHDLGIRNIEAPLPWCGFYITINPEINHKPADRLLQDLGRLDRSEQRRIIIENARRFINDPVFHDRVVRIFKRDGTGLSFAQERTSYSFLPRATPRSLVQLVTKAWNDSLYSRDVSKIFLNTLQWKDMATLMKQVFNWYGSTFDNRMGLLSGVDAGTASRFQSTRIQAMVLDSLPIQLWLHLSSQFSNQTLQRRLIWDPAFFRKAYNRLILHKTIIDSMVINTRPL